jgi:predicted nucleotidyltransferase
MVKEKYSLSEIKKIIKNLAKILTTNRIAVEKIILYGSYAKGNPRTHSDIDLAIISPDFK